LNTESLIAELASGLGPVRRLPGPGTQAMRWLALALICAALAAFTQSMVMAGRFNLRLGLPMNNWQAGLSLLTGVGALLAAAFLAHPDRSRRWLLLPLLPLAAWLGFLGWHWAGDVAGMGSVALRPGMDWACVTTILSVGLPLAAVQYRALRHAGAMRPTPVLLLGALAAAALCSTATSLVHPVRAAATILTWHGAAALMLMLLGAVLGRLLLQSAPRRA
jgi:hypothetical protein